MASDFASAAHKTADALERIADTLSRIEKILDTGLPGYVARRDTRPTVSQVVRADALRGMRNAMSGWDKSDTAGAKCAARRTNDC